METPDQYLFVKSRDRVKLLEYGLQMFQVGGLIYNVFLLVLYVLFDSTPETIYESSQIAKALAQKRFKFVLDW